MSTRPAFRSAFTMWWHLLKHFYVVLLAASILSYSSHLAYGADEDEPDPDTQAFLDRLAAHQLYRYFYVPPPASSTDTPAQRKKSEKAHEKRPVDPEITRKAYDLEIGKNVTDDIQGDIRNKTPRQIFDDFMVSVVKSAGEGGDILTAMEDENWKKKLILATVATLNANGENSPAAIKKLVQAGSISADHARLMWHARDMMVSKAADLAMKALRSNHPNLHFDLTVLDSGSFGSITSDIDKTLHLVARDSKGRVVQFVGPDGKVSYDDFIKDFYSHFDQVGKDYGAPAKKPAHLSLDTEFFTTDTLPESFAKGRFYTSAGGELPLNKAAAAKRRHFAALQRNPGPSYQFSGTIFAQVTGRAAEAQAGILERRLGAERQRRSSGPASTLAWEEALVFAHSACRQFSTTNDGKVRVREMDVGEFLESNNLVSKYHRSHAAENAAGNLEKLVHKVEAVYRRDGSFDPDAWSAKRNDIAKYHDRGGTKDAATAKIDDLDPPKNLGPVSRRFGPDDAMVRFGKQSPNTRPYTRSIHDQLFTDSLRRLHGGRSDADSRVRQDLDLLWHATTVSENILALKDNPDLPKEKPALWACSHGETYPDSKVLRPLTEHLKKTKPQFAGLDLDDPALLNAAKKLHVELAQRQTTLSAASNMNESLSLWLNPQHNQVQGIINAKMRSIFEQKREIARLRRQGDQDPETTKKIQALRQTVDEGWKTLDEMRRNPRGIEADIYMTGLETVRRAFLLYNKGGSGKAYAEVMALLSPEYKEAVRTMEGVWRAQAREAQKQRLASRAGLEPFQYRQITRNAVRHLGHGYMQSFGVDPDTFFGRAPPGTAVNVNSAGNVMKRFFHANYVNFGAFDSAGRLIRTMQMSEALPWDERMAMLSDAMETEFIMGVPVAGPLWTTYQGACAGDPTATMGGAISLGSEMTQIWAATAGQAAEGEMVAAGMAGRAATLGQVARMGGMASLALSLARTAVEIGGHEVYQPIRNHFLQLVTKGYVDDPPGAILRVGANKVDSRLPVTPLLATPGETGRHLFLQLKAEQAQQLADDFLKTGHARAAKALYEWALAGKENLGQDWREGTPISSPVMVDLGTDFEKLIGELSSEPLQQEGDTQSLVDRLTLARDAVFELLRGHQALQQAVKDRITGDAKRRDDNPENLNLWLLAARQNLGWHLDPYFKRETVWLAAALGGWQEESAPLFEDNKRILDRHRDHASSEFTRHLQSELETVLDTPTRFRILPASLKQAADDAQSELTGISWAHPTTMLNNYIAKNAGSWWNAGADFSTVPWSDPATMMQGYVEQKTGNWWNAKTKEQREVADVFKRRAAAATAFRTQGFSDPRSEWLERMDALRHTEHEIIGGEGESGTASVEQLKQVQQEQNRLGAQYQLLDMGFREAEAVVAPRVAHLRLLDWLDGTGAFDNDVHAAIRFVWHEPETQRMIRNQVAADLSSSRRLLWQYRGYRNIYRALIQAELSDLRNEYARVNEDIIQTHAETCAAKYAELRALAREQAQAYDGEMQMELEPDLLVTRGEDGQPELRVVADIVVSHDPLRAGEIELKPKAGFGVGLISGEDVETVIGSEAFERALRLTGLERDEVAFAARIDARVTSATPAEGYENLKYESLPSSEGHLLLFPGPPKPEAAAPLDLIVGKWWAFDRLSYQKAKRNHKPGQPLMIHDAVAQEKFLGFRSPTPVSMTITKEGDQYRGVSSGGKTYHFRLNSVDEENGTATYHQQEVGRELESGATLSLDGEKWSDSGGKIWIADSLVKIIE